jgi:hypothetical protein
LKAGCTDTLALEKFEKLLLICCILDMDGLKLPSDLTCHMVAPKNALGRLVIYTESPRGFLYSNILEYHKFDQLVSSLVWNYHVTAEERAIFLFGNYERRRFYYRQDGVVFALC